MVKSGGNAVLAQPKGLCLLVDIIIKILANKNFSDKLSQRAYIDARQYDWLKRAKKILDFINIYG